MLDAEALQHVLELFADGGRYLCKKNNSALPLNHFQDRKTGLLNGLMIPDVASCPLTELLFLESLSMQSMSIADERLRRLSGIRALGDLRLEDQVNNESRVEAIFHILAVPTMSLQTGVAADEIVRWKTLTKLLVPEGKCAIVAVPSAPRL